MLSEEEKKEYEELKSLLYTGTISQYGKRKLIDIIEKQQKELKEKNKLQPDCAEPIERTEEMVNMRWVNYHYISKDKLKEMLSGYKKALKDVEEAIAILKSNLLIVADEKYKKEIEKELIFREEDKISKITIINLLEDLLGGIKQC